MLKIRKLIAYIISNLFQEPSTIIYANTAIGLNYSTKKFKDAYSAHFLKVENC